MSLRFRTFLVGALVCFGAACSGDAAGTTEPTASEIRRIAGAGGADTVFAQLAQALVVEVRSGGRRRSGEVVRFEALPPVDVSGYPRSLFVCRLETPRCDMFAPAGGAFIVDTTDAYGRASVIIRLGIIAGRAPIAVSVPALGIADTVEFTVRAGSPDRLQLGVRDSAAYVGNGYFIGPVVVDRFGNARSGDAVTFLAFGSAATVSPAGLFRAVAIGRGGAVVRAGSITDTAWISVPPPGTIAAFDGGGFPAIPSGVVKVELDGSGYRTLVSMNDTYYGVFPDWTTAGEVVYEAGGYSIERLYITDTLGNVRRMTPESTTTRGEMFGAPARDGSVFFSALGGAIDYGTAIFRVASPGAVPTRVGPTPPGNANSWKASPSPDGTRLAYSDVNRGGLSIMNASTGSMVALFPNADMPRWSPQGTWIVFNADTTLYLSRPDGTGRTLAGPARFYGPRADWSPDGAWLVARTRNALELIQVATGTTVPLPWSRRLLRPSWKK